MIIHGEYIIIFWGKTDDHFWEGFRHQINSQSSEDVGHLMCKPGGISFRSNKFGPRGKPSLIELKQIVKLFHEERGEGCPKKTIFDPPKINRGTEGGRRGTPIQLPRVIERGVGID